MLSPDGTLQGFGVRGSAPGKFNVISGIARDERGYYYVSDILKSAVLVFDKNFRWLKEFGYRAATPGSLVAPVDVAAGDGKVFVSQFADAGRERLRGQGSRRSLIAGPGGRPITSTYMGLPFGGTRTWVLAGPSSGGFPPSGGGPAPWPRDPSDEPMGPGSRGLEGGGCALRVAQRLHKAPARE